MTKIEFLDWLKENSKVIPGTKFLMQYTDSIDTQPPHMGTIVDSLTNDDFNGAVYGIMYHYRKTDSWVVRVLKDKQNNYNTKLIIDHMVEYVDPDRLYCLDSDKNKLEDYITKWFTVNILAVSSIEGKI